MRTWGNASLAMGVTAGHVHLNVGQHPMAW